jgi:hypothetical protein
VGAACGGPGRPGFDVAASSLALLAFESGGYTPLSRSTCTDACTKRRVSFGAVVRRGLERLIARQDAAGRLDPSATGHALAALALAEAFGLTNTAAFRAPAQKALDVIAAGGCGRLDPSFGDDDVFAVKALISGRLAGLVVPDAAFAGPRAWLGRPGAWGRSSASAAVWLLLSGPLLEREANEDPARDALGLLSRFAPSPETDAYGSFLTTIVLFERTAGSCFAPTSARLDGSRWRDPLERDLIARQRMRVDGCADGSWDPAADPAGALGGRVCVTALDAMMLEVYER